MAATRGSTELRQWSFKQQWLTGITLVATMSPVHSAWADGPIADVPSAEATLHFLTSDPTVTLKRKIGEVVGQPGRHGGFFLANSYADLCTGSCTVKVPAGKQSFALSRGGLPVATDDVTVPAGESTMGAQYVSHSDVRWGLGIAGWVGILVGAGVVVDGTSGHHTETCLPPSPLGTRCLQETEQDASEIGIGLALLFGGILTSTLGVALNGDGTVLYLTPGVPALPAVGPGAAETDALTTPVASHGLTWGLTF
jgi:hypothetical protein